MDNYFNYHESSSYSNESLALNICEKVFKSGKKFPIDVAQLSPILRQQGLDYSDYGFSRCKDLFLSLPDFFKASHPLPTKMVIDLTPKMLEMLSPSAEDNAFGPLGDISPQTIYNATQPLTIPHEAHSVQLQHDIEDMQHRATLQNPGIKFGQRQPEQGNTQQSGSASERFTTFSAAQQPQTPYFNGQKHPYVAKQQAYASLRRSLGASTNPAFRDQRNILLEFFSHSAADQKQFANTLNRLVYMRNKDVTAAILLLLTRMDSLSATGWENILAFSYMLAVNENRIVESKDGSYMCFDTLMTDTHGEPIYFLAERNRFPGTNWILKGITQKSSRGLGQIIQDNFPFL